MIQRTKRGYIDTALVLPLLAEGRRGAIKIKTQAKTNSPAYSAAETMLQALDDLTEILTGDRAHFQDPLATAEHPSERTP